MEAGFIVIASVLIVASVVGLYVMYVNKHGGFKSRTTDTQGMLAITINPASILNSFHFVFSKSLPRDFFTIQN